MMVDQALPITMFFLISLSNSMVAITFVILENKSLLIFIFFNLKTKWDQHSMSSKSSF
jgi:hypothetical protein